MTQNPFVIRLSRRNVLLSVLVTAGLWGMPWFLWPVAPIQASTGRRIVPVIRYVRAAEGSAGTTWSPVVFPLPTPEGFSKKTVVPQPGPGMASVLKARTSEASYLELTPGRKETASMGLLTVRDEAAFRPQAVATAALYDRREGVQIVTDEALARRQFDAPGLAEVRLPEGSPLWVPVLACVEIDQRGLVRHVFVENSCGQTNVDARLVRALLSGTAAIGSEPVTGRVRLDYWRNVTSDGERRN